MAWLQSHQGLARHPKTKRFARLLGISVPQAIGHLHLLWWWALDYASDGDLTPFELEDIADAGGWEGDAEAFMRALIDAKGPSGHGFVDNGPDLQIHDWEEYAGRLIEQRVKNAERMKEARAKNVQHTCDTRTGARVEKSRVEKSREDKKKSYVGTEAFRLAELLHTLILSHNPNAKEPDLSKWAQEIDRMIRIDERDPQEIENIIRWCQGDEFWYANILSAKKLREKYDQLTAHMSRDLKKSEPKGMDGLRYLMKKEEVKF